MINFISISNHNQFYFLFFYFQGVFLSVLLCAGNRLTDIPRSVTEQSNLRELRVSYNQINSLKGLQISYLKRLEILDLSNNKIPRLDTLFPLTLSTLLLSNNGISELPVQLTALAALQSLQLTGTRIHTQHNSIQHKSVCLLSCIIILITCVLTNSHFIIQHLHNFHVVYHSYFFIRLFVSLYRKSDQKYPARNNNSRGGSYF
jgi:Leucine-rich repeat (LRR) protein